MAHLEEDRMEGQSSKRWYAAAEVAEMLGFGLSKTKLLIAMREIRSVKVGAHRRILPEWVDEYISHVTHEDSA
jgi:excisionase family DNA binding protein